MPFGETDLLSALQPVLATALDAVVVMGRDGLVTDWNTHAEKTFGWSRSEAMGGNMADLIIPPQYREAHSIGLKRYLETGEGPVLRRRFEITALHRDGREFPVELSITPTEGGDGLLFLGFLRDISDRKLAEDLLARRAREAELLSRVTRLASETESFDEALRACLQTICDMTGWPLGHAFIAAESQGEGLAATRIWHPQGLDRFQSFREATDRVRFLPGVGLPGRIFESGQPAWIAQIDADPSFVRGEAAQQAGIEAAFGFPIKCSGEVIAVLEFFAEHTTNPDPDLMLSIHTVGEQVGRVFERRRAEDRLRREKTALELEVGRREAVEEHQKLLLGELDHRVKNMLTVVSGIAIQTARASGSMEDFTRSFMDRLTALSRAHSLLTSQNWETTSLRSLAQEVLSPHVQLNDPRMDVQGPEVLLAPKTALSVSMILHELITNAAKHGALGSPAGAIRVRWTLEPTESGRLVLIWHESGLAGIKPPAHTGFGTKLIQASVRGELRGAVSTHWRDDGLEHRMAFPV